MVAFNYVYLYLLAPLHTGGTTQEGNLLGIARESHTNLPYIPSSTIRGRLRASTDEVVRSQLFGTELEDGSLEQGDLWIGDGSLLWLPVPSLSHGVVWISCPLLLQRWARLNRNSAAIPGEYTSFGFNINKRVYLKDAIFQPDTLTALSERDYKIFVPQSVHTESIKRVLILPDQHCATLIQMSLWRQVKIKLDDHKTVNGGFRYEEAIPPDTVIYFTWGLTAKSQSSESTGESSRQSFIELLTKADILQIGGQESLGRGFVQTWLSQTQSGGLQS